MDNAVFTNGGLYPSLTIARLRAALVEGRPADVEAKMRGEIERREAVAAGDMTRATAGERLNAVRG